MFNAKGFWDSLFALLDDLQQRGVIRGEYHQYIEEAKSLEELQRLIQEKAAV